MANPTSSDSSDTPEASSGARQQLRRELRARRRALPTASQHDHAAALKAQFKQSDFALFTGPVASYLASDGELDPNQLTEQLSTQRVVCLPVVATEPTNNMQFRRYQPGDPLTANRYGINEPLDSATRISGVQMQLMLLPLVGFDEQGNRLGMGGGYYDRFLGQLPLSLRPLLIGVAHECQHCESLPAQAWDIPLDGLITESRWHWFKKEV